LVFVLENQWGARQFFTYSHLDCDVLGVEWNSLINRFSVYQSVGLDARPSLSTFRNTRIKN